MRPLKRENNTFGFSLLEMLMAVLIVGLIMAIVVPNFQTQHAQRDIAMTKANLETIRTAIELYRTQEGGWPDDQLISLTDGNSPSGTIYLNAIPPEGITNSNVVEINWNLDGGWWWNTFDHTLHLDLSGTDSNGDQYGEY